MPLFWLWSLSLRGRKAKANSEVKEDLEAKEDSEAKVDLEAREAKEAKEVKNFVHAFVLPLPWAFSILYFLI